MHEAQQATESTLRTRLPPVDEEDEAGLESGEYSAAESGDEGVYRDADSDQTDTSFESSQSADGSSRDKGKGVDRGEAQRPPFRARPSSVVNEKEKHSRSWADLDPTMVVALVSPIGNWLTGSDHVKNLFLLLLLIFYLHQLIEGRLGPVFRIRLLSSFSSAVETVPRFSSTVPQEPEASRPGCTRRVRVI